MFKVPIIVSVISMVLAGCGGGSNNVDSTQQQDSGNSTEDTTQTVIDTSDPTTTEAVVNADPKIKITYSSLYDTVVVGDSVRLDVSESIDPEGQALSYSWEFLLQPPSSNLIISAYDYLDFAPGFLGDYSIQLTISDGVNSESQIFNYTAIESRVIFVPDTDLSLSVLEQVESVFGIGSTDLPETHDSEHLQLAQDTDVGDHLVFISHLEEDGDRATPLAQTDRQRSEIKSYSNSDESLTCEKDETMALDWVFKADNLNLSTSFTHFFQIKGESSHPLLTLTAKRTSGIEALRVNYGSDDIILGELTWEDANDRWLDVSLVLSCSDQGSLALIISDTLSKEALMAVNQTDLDMWQDILGDRLGFKWGLYRKVKANISDNEFKSGLEAREDKVRVSAIRVETY